ncbi:MAG: NAD-dependent epimerase/dehydratase family protein [Candidatus Omnitrophota bacterium]|jgi:dihydroflavonol-4-reductase|nr:MAG: NAD-dependent epimerase/dehydratase family protein [Candidatus Omnitrophota bacterium]
MKIFVTGATGFIGRHFIVLLKNNNLDARVLLREGSVLSGCPFEVVRGDIRDRRSLEKCMSGCDTLVHLAAVSAPWVINEDSYNTINFLGTKNLLDSALSLSFKKVIYVSTRATLSGQGKGQLIDESSQYFSSHSCDGYVRSKLLAEKLAIDYSGRGLPITIVNPTSVIGPFHSIQAGINKVTADYLKSRLVFLFINGNFNLVDVRDVAMGILKAINLGLPRQRYILGNVNITLRDFLIKVADISKNKKMLLELPYPAALALAFFAEKSAKITKINPPVTVAKVNMVRENNFCDNSKSRSLLKMDYLSLDTTITDLISCIKSKGLIT